ncbi:MAG TPA: HPr kinase/phosphatase C-terminal domain-containing protein [Croceibacterium sp.]|nr:HPr kinase/phosphatase C-terminal domain-containing protein [Croceibacterium sp.]
MSEVRQAGAVAIGGRALLIEGAPGSGKSSLALALIDRGAALIGDDGVTLDLRAGHVWAAPPPNTAGLIEIRNVGIVTLPTVEARVALVLRLDADAPRYVEQAAQIELLGRPIPLLRLHPAAWPLALRAEWAFARYALT